MNGRQLAQIALGTLGVYALLSAVSGFMVVIEALSGGPAGTTVLVVGMPALLLLGLSYILVFHNGQLAAALAPHADVPVEHGTPDIARVLVALVGIMTVLQTLPRLVNLVLNIFAAAGDPDAMPGGALRRALIGTGIEFACALFLVMRPERFLDFLNRSRSEPAEATA